MSSRDTGIQDEDITPVDSSAVEQVKVEFTEEDREALREALEDMVEPVDIYVFVSRDCPTCNETLKLMKIIADEAPVRPGKGKLIRLHVYHSEKDKDVFEKFNVSRVPTVALIDGYIRWTGTPSGEEIRALVETIIRISEGESQLDETSKRKIREQLKDRVYIEVIVTPLCPYCPYAALLANMVAYEAWKNGKPLVTANTIEAYENMDIAYKYQVMSVPVIAINGIVAYMGVPPEDEFVEKVVSLSRMRYETS